MRRGHCPGNDDLKANVLSDGFVVIVLWAFVRNRGLGVSSMSLSLSLNSLYTLECYSDYCGFSRKVLTDLGSQFWGVERDCLR